MRPWSMDEEIEEPQRNGSGLVDTGYGEVYVRPSFDESAPLRPSKIAPVPANDKATPEIGAIESAGKHEGEIYGGIWSKEYGGDNKPIWFLAAPKLMNHYNAAAWAEEQGGSLPTRKQGDYLTTLKGRGGAFTELFNRGTSLPAGFVWLAEPYANLTIVAWSQEVLSGYQYHNVRNLELPVLCVRR